MLYWMETVIVAFWTLVRLARLSREQPDDLEKVERSGLARVSLTGFFALHSGIFILVHFIFLWALFSGAWLKKVHDVQSFFTELIVNNGVWIALIFVFAANWISYLIDSRTPLARAVESTVQRAVERGQKQREPKPSDPVIAIVGALYIRIVIMQIAIIIGAWFAQAFGSIAPLILVIGLKTLIDLGLGSYVPLKDARFSYEG
jgi:hypothetical protein